MLNTEGQSDEMKRGSVLPGSSVEHLSGAADAAASARVTTSEFTSALQALEQRKAEEARRQADTVEVGKTIQDLNIDATPDEVMREVMAQRAAKQRMGGALPPLGGAPPQGTDAIKAASREQLSAAAAMLKEYYDRNLSPSRVQIGVPEARQSWRERRKSQNHPGQWVMAIGVIAFMVFMLAGHHGVSTQGLKNLLNDKTAAQTQLSKLAAGQTFYVDSTGLKKILSNGGVVNAADGTVMGSSEKDDTTWTVFNEGGKLYLKGYTLPIGLNDLTANPIKIFSQNDGGDLDNEKVNSVYVPLTGAKLDSSSGGDDYQEVTLEHILPDGNTRVSDNQDMFGS